MRAAFVVAALIGLPLAPLAAQGIVISPHFVFIPEPGRSTTIDLHNTAGVSMDVTLGTAFGSYATDSVGGILVVSDTNPPSTAPSAARWVEIYPRHVVLRPNQHQTVRILAAAPAGLPDGEYRARLVVASRAITPPQAPPEEGETRIALNFEIRTSLSLIYRKGAVTTGVKISNPRATVNGDYLDVRLHLEKLGNASYFGRLRGGLLDASNRVVVPLEVVLGLNDSMDPRFRLPLGNKLRSGTYTLRLTLATDRSDIPPDDLLPAPREVWEGKIVIQRGY